MTLALDAITIHAQLRELEIFREKSRRLFENIPALVISTQGKILLINSSAEQTMGISKDKLLGKTFHSAGCLINNEHGHRLSKDKYPWAEAIRLNALIPNSVIELILPNQASQWFQTTSMPLEAGPETKTRSSVTILTNITKYKHSQTQLLQSQKMEAIGSLAGGLAHDFNNILSSIRTAAQLLLIDKDEKNPDYETLKDIENETMRGAELIKQLLLFSKPVHTKSKTTNIHESITQLRKLLRRTTPQNIKIETQLAKENILANIDATQFEQIILNLAINSRHAMAHGGTLQIKTSIETWTPNAPGPVDDSRNGTYARVEVLDTGVGIAQENISRIFEPFYTSKAKSGGTGLGLSIVYAIIHEHKGYITVDSKPSLGTSIAIFIPARHRKLKKHSQETVHSKPLGGTETILVVDDECIITRSTARFLERYGYKTLTAFDGRKAMELFKEHESEIDLVLMDMEMPEISGSVCLERMLTIRPSSKIITLSGHVARPGQWDPIKAGAKHFVQKPFDSNELLTIIRQTLDHKPVD